MTTTIQRPAIEIDGGQASRRPMLPLIYSTVMVHVDVDAGNDGLLAIASKLARRLGAGVIGVAACQTVEMMYGAGRMTGDLIELDRERARQALAQAETRFRTALRGAVEHVEWRGGATCEALADFIAREARSADIILTGPDGGGGFANGATRASIGDLVMRAGRPVLIVPDDVKDLNLEHVMVAWKDTREARRAVSDALPLLALAERVSIVELAEKDLLKAAQRRVDDVAAWLDRHGVAAAAAAVAMDRHENIHLEDLARKNRADLMVAGAYGHVRLLEWMFGGVTCDQLMHPSRCVLVSH